MPKGNTQLTDTESSDIESGNEMDQTMNAETVAVEVETVEKKKKVVSMDNFTSLVELFTNLQELDSSFSDIEKEFEKTRRDYVSDRKRVVKEMQQLFKKLNKSLPTELNKKKTKRSGGNSGGFTKKLPVPEKLRAYLELDDDVEMTRPQVMSMLNTKFNEAGFRDGKVVTISSSKVAKALGCKKNHTIEFAQFQTFLKKFYDEEKSHVENA